MKSGIVTLVGRPNTGKSTLLNAILGHKVAITSPKPQTTRFPIEAVYEDTRGQIIFVDTPGIFGRTPDTLSKQINANTKESLEQHIDIVLYVIDHTRERDMEENKALGIVRTIQAPKKILVINKTDVRTPDHSVQYAFMKEEFDETIEISALKRHNLNVLIDTIFDCLSEGEKIVDTASRIQPGLNLDSKLFVSELIREKAFLFLRDEVPYTLTTIVDTIEERENGNLYVKARILTGSDKYKGMIIGKSGAMIKEISMATRKELETATGKKAFVELNVETDPHWMQYLS